MRFETEALEPFMVKGKKHPVLAFRVGKILGSSRSDDLADLPLVGRDRELEVLRGALKEAAGGRGTLVEVVGDAGIGKSRLLQEVHALDPEMPWHAVSCEPYEASTPYFPFNALLRGLLGLPLDLDDDEAVAALETRVREACPELLPWLPLFAVPLDLDIPDTPEVAALEEQYRRERLEGAIGDLLVEAATGPEIAVIEDAQWMDEASADLSAPSRRAWTSCRSCSSWRAAIRRGERGRSRALPHAARAGPLSPEASVSLIHLATEEAPLTPQAVDLLVRRSGGGPRFLKAMLHAVIESGGSVEELPGSVEGLVMAQIDRLPPRDRTRLRHLSVLGMSFTEELATRLLEEEGLETGPAAVRPLSGLLEPDGRGGLRFRNGLVRDVAYESLPFRRRGSCTRGSGRRSLPRPRTWTRWPRCFVPLPARAAVRGGVAVLAPGRRLGRIHLRQRGGREFYRRALEAARRLPTWIPGGFGGLRGARGPADPPWRIRRCRRVVSVGATADPGRPVAQARLLFKEAQAPDRQGRYTQALRTLSRGIRLLGDATEGDAARQRSQLVVQYGGIRYAQGRFADAVSWCQRAIREAESSGDLDALAHAYYVLDVAYVAVGRMSDAEWSPKALELYEELGDLGKQAIVLENMAGLEFWRGNWNESLGLWKRGRDVCLKVGAQVEAAYGTVGIGEILVYQGHLEEAEEALREGLRVFERPP